MLFCKNISQWVSKSSNKQFHVNRTLLPQKISISSSNCPIPSLNYKRVSFTPFSTLSNKIIPSPINPLLSEFNGKSNLTNRLHTILFIQKTIRQNGRNIFGSSNGKRLKDLETRANSNPNDSELQAKYMKELIKTKPLEAQKRFESKKFEMNQESEKYYLLALAKLNKYEDVRLDKFLGRNNGHTFGGSGGSGSSGSSDGSGYQGWFKSPEKPIPVVVTKSWGSSIFNLLFSPLLFLLVIVGIIGYWPKGSGSSLEDLYSVQKSHELITKVPTRFDDIRGIDEVKRELQSVVEFLKNPQKFTKIGAKLPKGVLLFGAPGTGKTLIARAVAGEAGVPFFYVSGSSFEEVFVGVGSKRIRQLFEDARKNAPCIIFIDEIDSVGSQRSKQSLNSRDNTLNQLLTEMDGFQQTKGIIVIAATNFPKVLDGALTRPGRFDKQIEIHFPDLKGRKEILDFYFNKVKVGPDVNSNVIAKATFGFSAAKLENLVNLAAIKSALKGQSSIDMSSVEDANDEIQLGVKRNITQTPEELKMVAYHESGHALVGHYIDPSTPVYKITAVPRGHSLGVTIRNAHSETSRSKKQYMNDIAVSLGGRIAEELIFGDENVTSGAQNDLEKASRIAREMILNYGMNSKVGRVYNFKENMSENEKRMVDEEVRTLIEKLYADAQTILKNHEKELHILAEALVENEVLTGDQMKDIIAGKKIVKPLKTSQSGKVNPIL